MAKIAFGNACGRPSRLAYPNGLDAVISYEAQTGKQTVPAPAAAVESYSYDPAGNRIASHLSSGATTVDASNRVVDDGINRYAWTPD